MSNGVEIDTENSEVYGVRKLRKSGDSYVISIPPEVLKQSGLEADTQHEVVAPFAGGEIVIRPPERDGSGDDG